MPLKITKKRRNRQKNRKTKYRKHSFRKRHRGGILNIPSFGIFKSKEIVETEEMKKIKEKFFEKLLKEINNVEINNVNECKIFSYFNNQKIDNDYINSIIENHKDRTRLQIHLYTSVTNDCKDENKYIVINKPFYYALNEEIQQHDDTPYPYIDRKSEDSKFKVRLSQNIYDDLKKYIEKISNLTEEEITKLADQEIENEISKLTDDIKTKLTEEKKIKLKDKYKSELILIKDSKAKLTDENLKEYIFIEE